MLQVEQVISEVSDWLSNISEQYHDSLKINITKANTKVLLVDFENDNYLAQLVVEDIGFHPYRFCSFSVLDVNQDSYQKDAYCYYDNENSNMHEILEHLTNGVLFMIG